MKAFETITVNSKVYNLKFSMSEIVKLEAKIGTDLLTGMDKLTVATTLAEYYYAALKPFNDDISTIEDVYQLFDSFTAEGGTYEDLQQKIGEVLVLSGIMSQKTLAKQKAAKLTAENGAALSD